MWEDFEAALADFTRALESAPEAWIYVERCVTYNWSGDPWTGVDDCTRAIEMDPQPWYCFERASAYDDMGDCEAALEDGNTCVALDSQDAWCYWHRAWAYNGVGDVGAAVADLASYLDLLEWEECPECHEDAQAYIDEQGP